jgi:hypothetical protein
MRLWLVWVAFLSLPASAASIDSPPNLNAWLSHVAKATQQLTYDGTYIYQHDDSVEISHISIAGIMAAS